MSKIVKPDLTYQWASAAGGGKVAPDSTKIQAGHIVEKPNYEYMNWLQNRQDVSLAYTFQMGVVEWDSLIEYQYNSSYKSYVQRNGLIYKALQTGTNKDPATETAYWALAFDNYGSAAAVQTNLNTHITNYGTLASLSNAATARFNLGVYSAGQVDTIANTKAALAGDSGQVFSAANGTTGNQVVNKSQLDTKAELAGSSSQEFAVATATSSNSAVPKTQFDAKTGLATDTVAGIVEKALLAELVAGTANKFPDSEALKQGFSFDTTNKEFRLSDFLGNLSLKMGSVTTGNLIGTPNTNENTVNFTTPFPTACLAAFAVPKTTGSSDIPNFWVSTHGWNASSMVVWLFEAGNSDQGIGAGFNWFAIGY
jgi:hypothetical protein